MPRIGSSAATILAALQAREILGGVNLGRWYGDLADTILMNATELTTDADIAKLSSALAAIVKEHDLVRA